MKRIILGAGVVLLALVIIAFWMSCGRRNVTKQTASRISPQAEVNPQSGVPSATIPDADKKDYELWRKTPEYKTFEDENQRIFAAAEARGAQGERADAYFTSNEVAFLITYMQSPHPRARVEAVITAGGMWRSDPAKSVLLPHVISLLLVPVLQSTSLCRRYPGEIGDKSTIPYLGPLLDDHNLGVAAYRLGAIKKLEQR